MKTYSVTFTSMMNPAIVNTAEFNNVAAADTYIQVLCDIFNIDNFEDGMGGGVGYEVRITLAEI